MTDQPLRLAGANVSVDPGASIFRPDLLSVGSNVRIDTGVVISGTHSVTIGDYVHLAAGAKIFSSGGPVVISDFANLSSDVKLYTASDDYVNGSLTNPMVPDEFKDVQIGDVHLDRHVVVGAGSVILPGVTIGFGASVGALSLVRADVKEGDVVAGVPARRIARRDIDRLRRLESALRKQMSG